MRPTLVVTGLLSLALAYCARLPTPQEAKDAVLMLREYGGWAWALGIALIWADLVLPIPQTAVIAALGIIFGVWLGGLLDSFGLIAGGLLGYGLMFTSARRLVQRFAGLQSLHKMERSFERRGPGPLSSRAACRSAFLRQWSFSLVSLECPCGSSRRRSPSAAYLRRSPLRPSAPAGPTNRL
jgi:hypothetical protein